MIWIGAQAAAQTQKVTPQGYLPVLAFTDVLAASSLLIVIGLALTVWAWRVWWRLELD